jgi:hypothetical protein
MLTTKSFFFLDDPDNQKVDFDIKPINRTIIGTTNIFPHKVSSSIPKRGLHSIFLPNYTITGTANLINCQVSSKLTMEVSKTGAKAE